MGIEGGLEFQLHCHGGRVTAVNIHSTRPLQAVRIFEGKTPAEMLQTLPLLFHVCGVAQASAAVTACEQALAITPAVATLHAREMLVWMETAREHLWRIMMDWTDRLEEKKDKTRLVQLQQCLPGLKKALFPNDGAFAPDAKASINEKEVLAHIATLNEIIESHVFAMPANEWLNISSDGELECWVTAESTLASRMLCQVWGRDYDALPELDVGYLPELNESALHLRLCEDDADAFTAQPTWEGKVCETTALSRQLDHPLVLNMIKTRGVDMLTRMTARLIELATLPAKLEQSLQMLCSLRQKDETIVAEQNTGVGIGQIEAARGRLIHRVALEQGIIQRYQIVAPTEWNFHPQGVAAQLLKTLAANHKDKLRQQADLLINTIDPCVRYDMTVH